MTEEEKCMEHVLKTLLKQPIQNSVMWHELEPYKDIRRFVLSTLLAYGIIRLIKIPVSLTHKKIMYLLNIQHEFLTDPSTRFYFPGIARQIMQARVEAQKTLKQASSNQNSQQNKQ